MKKFQFRSATRWLHVLTTSNKGYSLFEPLICRSIKTIFYVDQTARMPFKFGRGFRQSECMNESNEKIKVTSCLRLLVCSGEVYVCAIVHCNIFDTRLATSYTQFLTRDEGEIVVQSTSNADLQFVGVEIHIHYWFALVIYLLICFLSWWTIYF